MKRLLLLAMVGAVLLSAGQVIADDGFYVIAAGGGVGKPITSVPCTITQQGFYYLKDNLTYSGSGNAITVNANDVTLDLMGFCLTGPGKTSGTNRGIKIQDGASNVEIRNGSIKDFGEDGINSNSSAGIRVMGVRVRNVGGAGIRLIGTNHVVAGCSVMYAEIGIKAASNCLIKGNIVIGSVSDGIFLGTGSMVADNVVQGNGGRGICCSGLCTITGNTASNNTSEGIYAANFSTVTNNNTDGLVDIGDCTLANNTISH